MTSAGSFSLLLPVYRADRPEFLARAFTSSVDAQSRRPDEVVIVQDGPVTPELTETLSSLRESSPVPVRLVALDANRGLAHALRLGVAECEFDIIARIDADDESLPDRFELQISALIERDLDLIGGGMIEFESVSGRDLGVRIPPQGEGISAYARFHDPFNHPTVMYRREAVLRAGGYRQDIPLMEDYSLFARMIHTGARVDNLDLPLVRYRVDEGAYKRRGGLAQLQAEWRLQRELKAIGFTSAPQYMRNLVIRGLYRLVPLAIRRRLYRRVFVQVDNGPETVSDPRSN